MVNDKEMKRNMIGYAIQYFREKYDISQGVLCKGLCSVTTLSRIEGGERDVDTFILEALLERMGQTPNKFELVLTERDYVLYHLREEIKTLIDRKDSEMLIKSLSKYSEISKSRSSVHKQFIKCIEAKINELEGGSIDVSMELLLEAISYTVPSFQTHVLEGCHFSITELNIMSDISYYKYQKQEMYEAKAIVKSIIDYINTRTSLEITNRIYAKSIVVISRILMKEEAFEEALELCESGIKYNSRTRTLDYKGELSLIKAEVIEHLVVHKQVSNYKQSDYLRCYLQAYYVFEFLDEFDKADRIKQYIQEVHPWVNIDWEKLSV